MSRYEDEIQDSRSKRGRKKKKHKASKKRASKSHGLTNSFEDEDVVNTSAKKTHRSKQFDGPEYYFDESDTCELYWSQEEYESDGGFYMNREYESEEEFNMNILYATAEMINRSNNSIKNHDQNYDQEFPPLNQLEIGALEDDEDQDCESEGGFYMNREYESEGGFYMNQEYESEEEFNLNILNETAEMINRSNNSIKNHDQNYDQELPPLNQLEIGALEDDKDQDCEASNGACSTERQSNV